MIEDIINFNKWFFNYILDKFYSAIASVFSAIPVPDFIAEISTYGQAVGGQTAFYLGVMRFDDGMALIITALLARFILRRIPGIG